MFFLVSTFFLIVWFLCERVVQEGEQPSKKVNCSVLHSTFSKRHSLAAHGCQPKRSHTERANQGAVLSDNMLFCYVASKRKPVPANDRWHDPCEKRQRPLSVTEDTLSDGVHDDRSGGS